MFAKAIYVASFPGTPSGTPLPIIHKQMQEKFKCFLVYYVTRPGNEVMSYMFLQPRRFPIYCLDIVFTLYIQYIITQFLAVFST